MKTSTRNFLTTVILILHFSFSVYAQTYVSGGVYNNTTWTLANSPYIVTDTVVVFPGVTLTIEPGVVMKFDSAIVLEIRQSTLIAIGDSADSITFTSNSGNPHAGIWKGVKFNNPVALSIDYCIFKYADRAVYTVPWITPQLTASHSSFYYNTTCFTDNYWPTTIKQCLFYNNENCISEVTQGVLIDSCYFFNNTVAVTTNGNATINNCTFAYNQTGTLGGAAITNCNFCNNVGAVTSSSALTSCTFIQNHIAEVNGYYMTGNIFFENDTAINNFSIDSGSYAFNNSVFNNHVGIIFGGSNSLYNSLHMYNNNVCHNTVYNLSYTNQNNVLLNGVCWYTTDSASIAAGIYDGYDNVTYGLVDFIPFTSCNDSVLPSITFSCPGITTGFAPTEIADASFTIYPNPASQQFEINNRQMEIESLVIYNTLGEKIYSVKVLGHSATINCQNFARGIYYVRLNTGERQSVQKLVIE